MDKEPTCSLEEDVNWDKALLSRNFDLCHTRLLMLDGDLANEERLHLVRELFSTIKEIERVILKEDSAQSDAKSTLEQMLSSELSASDLAATCVSSDNSSLQPQDETDFSRIDLTFPEGTCPICCHQQRKPFRHYCDSCRIFSNRLLRMREDDVPLPDCHHRGQQILFGCKGCRRFRFQLYWPVHKSEPFPLPEM